MSIETPLPAAETPSLIEQEWCNQCTHDLGDDPGMGRDIIGTRVLPTDEGPQSFLELTCGHRVAIEDITLVDDQLDRFDEMMRGD